MFWLLPRTFSNIPSQSSSWWTAHKLMFRLDSERQLPTEIRNDPPVENEEMQWKTRRLQTLILQLAWTDAQGVGAWIVQGFFCWGFHFRSYPARSALCCTLQINNLFKKNFWNLCYGKLREKKLPSQEPKAKHQTVPQELYAKTMSEVEEFWKQL